LETLGKLDKPVELDRLGPQVELDPQVKPVPLDLWEQVPLGKLVRQVKQGKLGLRVYKVYKVYRVYREIQDLRVERDLLVELVPQDKPVGRDLLVL
jgi:hypothetical protein